MMPHMMVGSMYQKWDPHRRFLTAPTARRPPAWVGIESQKNGGGKKSAEKHPFGREKQPDADLRVPQTGVRSSGYCVRNFHWLMHQCRLGHSPGSLRRFDRFVLHGEIFFAARQAVFVGTPIRNRSGNKVSVRWR